MESKETSYNDSQKQMFEEAEIIESSTHSFVVNIWLEETRQEAGNALWRGNITHVSRFKKYQEKKPKGVHRLEDIVHYVADYLEQMGVRLSFCWRLRRWLKL